MLNDFRNLVGCALVLQSLELILSQMAQKPMLRGEVGAFFSSAKQATPSFRPQFVSQIFLRRVYSQI